MRDEEIRELARKLIREQGVNGATSYLGVSRNTVLYLAAGAPCNPGTFSLVRERLSAAQEGAK